MRYFQRRKYNCGDQGGRTHHHSATVINNPPTVRGSTKLYGPNPTKAKSSVSIFCSEISARFTTASARNRNCFDSCALGTTDSAYGNGDDADRTNNQNN